MATPDSDTSKQLLKAIQKMNQNLESSTFAINNMTMQMNSFKALITENPTLPCKVKCGCGKEAPKVIDAKDATTGTLGYINWDTSHDFLKNQRLVKMTILRESLEDLIEKGNNPVQQNSIAIPQTSSWGHPVTPKLSGCFKFSKTEESWVDKEARFPMDAVYVDVESPRVKKEIQFMNEINVLPTKGVIDRFLRIVESERHTYASFEKKYGLKWVNEKD